MITIGFQARSRGGSWSWTLSPKEIMSREVERGFESWTFSLQVVPQQQCNGHCICDSVQARQLKQQLRSAQVAAQRRGDTSLTFPLFWWRSTVSPVEPSLFRPVSPPPPPPPPSPSLISILASVDVKRYGQGVPSDVLFRVVGSLMSHYLSLCTGLFCCVCILQIQIIIVVDVVAAGIVVGGGSSSSNSSSCSSSSSRIAVFVMIQIY